MQMMLKENEAFGDRSLFCKRMTEQAQSMSVSKKRFEENLSLFNAFRLRLLEFLNPYDVL